MAEATNSVHLAKLRARLTSPPALKATKANLRAQGLKFTHFSRRDIVVRADAYLGEHREELIAEAKQIVERWERQGFSGRRAALNTGAQRRKA